MIFFAAILTAIFYAAAIWVYVWIPHWGNLRNQDGLTWYMFGWTIPFAAATVPTVLMWQNL